MVGGVRLHDGRHAARGGRARRGDRRAAVGARRAAKGARGAAAPRQLSGRGVAYWTDGKEERILYVTPGYRLVALDAKTGAPHRRRSARTASSI